VCTRVRVRVRVGVRVRVRVRVDVQVHVRVRVVCARLHRDALGGARRAGAALGAAHLDDRLEELRRSDLALVVPGQG
jgi:hypothetical protein